MNARILILATLMLGAVTIPTRSVPAQQPAAIKQKQSPKTVKVAFVNAEWREVFKWLFEQTGKPIMSCTPNGRFTLVGPPDKEYTIAEVIAAINEAFAKQPQQFILIERRSPSASLLATASSVAGDRRRLVKAAILSVSQALPAHGPAKTIDVSTFSRCPVQLTQSIRFRNAVQRVRELRAAEPKRIVNTSEVELRYASSCPSSTMS